MEVEVTEWCPPNGTRVVRTFEFPDEIAERLKRENIRMEYEVRPNNLIVHYLTRPGKEDYIIIMSGPLTEEVLNAEIDRMLKLG